MMRRSIYAPQIDVRKRETSKSSVARSKKEVMRFKGRKPGDDVQELYRPKRSSLGYKLLDYNVLSTLTVKVVVQVRRRHPRIQVLVMNNIQASLDEVKGSI